MEQQHRRRRVSARVMRRRRIVAGALVVLLLGGGYTAAVAIAPLPELQPTFEVTAEVQLDADSSVAQAAVDAQPLPTAIGWADGEAVWTNDETLYTLASVSKLITVLVALEEQPLEAGADGPTYTWTAEDRRRQNGYIAQNGVAYPIPVGTELTLRQMLTFIFLPSANDYAAAYAYWVFGDNAGFLAALDRFKEKHGLHSITLVEPTGMDPRNQASAADLVRVARLALQSPTLREFNGMQSAEMPWGVGLIENTNPLLGEVPGVIGVKTGSLDAVGYNFVLAQQADAMGRELINISVTLARPSKAARAQSGRDMLAAMAELPQRLEVVTEGERIGSVTTWQGEEVALVAASGMEAVLVPGEAVRRTSELIGIGAGEAGRIAGAIRVGTPTGGQDVDVVTTAPIVEPDLWWRLANPGLLFGGR